MNFNYYVTAIILRPADTIKVSGQRDVRAEAWKKVFFGDKDGPARSVDVGGGREEGGLRNYF